MSTSAPRPRTDVGSQDAQANALACLAGRGRAPDLDGQIALQDHVIGEDMRHGHVGNQRGGGRQRTGKSDQDDKQRAATAHEHLLQDQIDCGQTIE